MDGEERNDKADCIAKSVMPAEVPITLEAMRCCYGTCEDFKGIGYYIKNILRKEKGAIWRSPSDRRRLMST